MTQTKIRKEQLDLSDVDYSFVTANDAATDVTAAELEELTDGSETTLHSHAAGGAANGWTISNDTWTRTGDFTFTIASDVTSIFQKGTKVKYDDGAVDYGVVLSSSYSAPNTTITLITNSDYAMVAATITNKYYSYIENPAGFPDWFNYTPTVSGAGTMTYGSETVDFCKWSCHGKTINFQHRIYGTIGGTPTGGIEISAPTSMNLSLPGVFVSTILNVSPAEIGRGVLNTSTNNFDHIRIAGAWSTGSSKYVIGQGSYPL